MVIATCDAFHAMTSDRSYRQAMGQRRGDPRAATPTPAPSSTRWSSTRWSPSWPSGASSAAAEVAEHRLFGHPDQAEAAVGTHVAAAHADVGAVRADDLDDRADVADLAVVAVVAFDRLHLLGHHLADLALVKRHLT